MRPEGVLPPRTVGIAQEPPVSNAKLAIVLFIASEAMLFTGLIVGYVVLRGGSDGFAGMDPLPVGLAGFSSSILLGSSIALFSAQRAIAMNRLKTFRWGTLLALTMGLLFIALQGVEWNRLVGAGLFPESNVHSGIFYALSGIHGLHVFGGLVLLVILVVRAFRGAFTPRKRNFVIVTAYYWHFVTLVWLALFTMLFVL